jgi:ribosomal protein S18 acetylase RimI-like enzyme
VRAAIAVSAEAADTAVRHPSIERHTPMEIRPYQSADLPTLVDLTIEVFGPFYEQSFRSMVPADVFLHQHGSWADDYRESVPKLHDPDHHKHVSVAVGDTGGMILGYIAWVIDPERRHGDIDIVAVRESARGRGVGRRLCEEAMRFMRERNIEVVGLGTGGDSFHAPARALYESLGFHLIPVAVYMRAL